MFTIYRSPLRAELQLERDRGSGIEGLTWAGKFGVCLPGSLPGSNGTSWSPGVSIPGSFPKYLTKDRAKVPSPPVLPISAGTHWWGRAIPPQFILSEVPPVILLSHIILVFPPNLAGIALFMFLLTIITLAAFPSIRGEGIMHYIYFCK